MEILRSGHRRDRDERRTCAKDLYITPMYLTMCILIFTAWIMFLIAKIKFSASLNRGVKVSSATVEP
jgi:hypothetical protein